MTVPISGSPGGVRGRRSEKVRHHVCVYRILVFKSKIAASLLQAP